MGPLAGRYSGVVGGVTVQRLCSSVPALRLAEGRRGLYRAQPVTTSILRLCLALQGL